MKIVKPLQHKNVVFYIDKFLFSNIKYTVMDQTDKDKNILVYINFSYISIKGSFHFSVQWSGWICQ